MKRLLIIAACGIAYFSWSNSDSTLSGNQPSPGQFFSSMKSAGFSPRSPRDAAASAKQTVNDVKDKVEDLGNQVNNSIDKAREVYDDAEAAVDRGLQVTREATEKAVNAVDEGVEHSKSALTKVGEKTISAGAASKKAIENLGQKVIDVAPGLARPGSMPPATPQQRQQ